MADPLLTTGYVEENQIQAITPRAVAIEHATGIKVSRCHMGDPQGPTPRRANEVLAKFYKHRGHERRDYGYADVQGRVDFREEAAKALGAVSRLAEGDIKPEHLLGVTGGTGGLTAAWSAYKDRNPAVLVPDPTYPPWRNIAGNVGVKLEFFPLRAEDDYLLNEELLSKQIDALLKQDPNRPILLNYHYPHNPTGKTLTEDDAKALGKTLNALCAKYPNLRLIQEDIYLGTTAPGLGLYTPLQCLDAGAKAHTILIHSLSKLGHVQERAALMTAWDPEIVTKLRHVISAQNLGASSMAMLGAATTLDEIAKSGMDPITAKGSDPNNHRYLTGRYYQERLKIIYDGLHAVEEKLGTKMFQGGMPQGAYYLFPSFECLRGKPIPQELAPLFKGKTTFESADDLMLALENADRLGLRPVTTASGSFFDGAKAARPSMHLRISTVEQNKELLREAANTMTGLVQKTLGRDDLGAVFHTPEELRVAFPIESDKKMWSAGISGIPASARFQGDSLSI